MSARAERVRRVPTTIRDERMVDFDPEARAAPMMLRFGAVFIDYIAAIIFPTIFLLASRFFGGEGAKLLSSGLNDIGWLIAFVILFSNLIILPMATGRTLGKMLTGTQIVRSNGTPASVKAIILRQTVGYLLTVLTLGAGLILAAFGRRGRALHDLISGTMVIFAAKRTKS
ncbi:MAG: RDD family protein [Blastocatellia bacterium]|nr:RDD family protein [Blastocatellia bacterium]